MSCPRPYLQFSPVPASALRRAPLVLLLGSHQPRLLDHLDGWPKRWVPARQALVKFAPASAEALQALADDSVDLLLIGRDAGPLDDALLRQALRVARQGLISLR